LKLDKPKVKSLVPQQSRDVARRWTPTLIEDGFTPISNTFLMSYARLDPPVTSSEAILIAHLIHFKWDKIPPKPALTTLARRMGITATAVRNHVRSLEKKCYLFRHRRAGRPNLFDLRPLFLALEKLRHSDRAKRIQAAHEMAAQFEDFSSSA
jgi:DNA-binding MarR family transcriptional regulator